MKKKFYLPGLNSQSRKEVEIIEDLQEIVNQINETTTPLLHKFIHKSSDFYRENFNELEKCKKREKRLLEFETPNRAKITHEYDVSLDKGFNYNNFYYLLNPTNRLSWLKIKQDGKRILLASNNDIKLLVKNKLDEEIKKTVTLQGKRDDFFDYIWKKQLGYPCFIRFEKANKNDFLIEAEYFDSIKEITSKKYYYGILSPFDERSIVYEYEPLCGYSSWLYVRAPKDFNASIDIYNDFDTTINKIEFFDDESDPTINTLTIINKPNSPKSNVKMNIDITVPSSRKIWFLAIYWASILTVGLLLNNVYISFFNPIFSMDFSFTVDIKIVLSLVAGIITIRGWLISEETIFKRYSIYLTCLLVLLVGCSLLLTIVAT